MGALWEDVSVPGTLGLGISAKQICPRSWAPSPRPQGLPWKWGNCCSPRPPGALLSDCRAGAVYRAYGTLQGALRPEKPQGAEEQDSLGVKNSHQPNFSRGDPSMTQGRQDPERASHGLRGPQLTQLGQSLRPQPRRGGHQAGLRKEEQWSSRATGEG